MESMNYLKYVYALFLPNLSLSFHMLRAGFHIIVRSIKGILSCLKQS